MCHDLASVLWDLESGLGLYGNLLLGEERRKSIKSSLVRRRSTLSQGRRTEAVPDRTQPEVHQQEKEAWMEIESA